ncbi:hypothetical protein QBC38DRAFT_455656 [Podospora fimiseda]|uniref:Uncharacterized protein n=1 Tax=Podospora fimiseda TaxID=252190 RepID=A0AAN7BPC5_9PEZI|nr:hypothetical protein QBC38DRAFT_455656 [Podospora fimiseda]
MFRPTTITKTLLHQSRTLTSRTLTSRTLTSRTLTSRTLTSRTLTSRGKPAEQAAAPPAGNKIYAIVATLVLGVGGYYGLMMGSPRTAVSPSQDKGSMAGTSAASKRGNESAGGKVDPNKF